MTRRRSAAGPWCSAVTTTTRAMHRRHVVMATGGSGNPNMPDILTLGDFKGRLLHTSRYEDGEDFGRQARHRDRHRQQRPRHNRAGSSYSSGADVMLVQRSPTLVTNIEPSAQPAYATY